MTVNETPTQIGEWRIVGNQSAVTQLTGALRQNRTSHAYLFTGQKRVGKLTLAIDLARALNCNPQPSLTGEATQPPCGTCSSCDRILRELHPDVRIVTNTTPTSKDADELAAERRVMIGIDLITDILASAVLEPFEGRLKVFIIDQAQLMSPEAANKLLKTLEEPPEAVQFILTASAAEQLPQTIVSRCQEIRLHPVPEATIAEALVESLGAEPSDARTLAKLALGSPGWAIAALNDPGLRDRKVQTASTILNVLASDLPDRFQYSNELSSEFRRDRTVALDELDEWLTVTRDLAIFKSGLTEKIVFESRMSQLDDAAQSLTEEDIAHTMDAVISTREALLSNAYPPLAFDSMMLQLP